MGTPFKMKGMDFGNSPVKQTTSQERALQSKIAKEYKLPVSKKSSIPKGFNVTGSRASTTPKYNMKNKGNFNFTGSKASKTPGFSTTKIAKGLGKVGKFLGGKALGVLGMMGAGTLSASATPTGNQKKKGTYTSDITKMKGYKK